jgi:hypothetical protein
VDEPGRRPQHVQGVHPPHVAGRLVSNPRLPFGLSVEVEEPRDEIGIGNRPALDQGSKLLLSEGQADEVRVVEE